MPLLSRKSDKESSDDANGDRLKSEDPERTDETDETRPVSRLRSALLFGRDIAVAFIIVGIVIGTIYAYTGVWPPMVVIESGSMQHSGTVSYVGVIDTGDLVLVQAAPQRSDVTTWVEGKAVGYKTYGNYGDVIIFRKPNSDTPIIHRPIFWMDYDPVSRTFSIPDLERLPHNVTWGGSYDNGSAVIRPYRLNGTMWIKGAGWRGDLNITFSIKNLGASNKHSGYVTLGDNNGSNYDPTLARQEDVIGKARGEMPWFGLIKLTLFPTGSTCCTRGWGDPYAPKNSWDSLTISLVLAFATPILLDVSSSLWARRRKQNGDEGEDEGEDDRAAADTRSGKEARKPSV